MTTNAKQLIAFLAVTLFCGSASGENNASQTQCTDPTGTEIRIIRLEYENPESPIPCAVLYEKGGATQQLANAKNTQGYCEKKERNVVGNLVGAGWSCQHQFFGDLADQDRTLKLNLFGSNAAATNIEHDGNRALAPVPGSDADPAVIQALIDSETEYLKKQIGQSILDDLQAGLQAEIIERLGDRYDTDVAVSLKLDLSLTPLPDPATEIEVVSSPPRADSEADQVASRTSPAAEQPANASQPGYMLASRALASESEAHRFAGQFRRIYPGISTHVASTQKGDAQWHVVLGESNEASVLGEGLAMMDPKAQEYFNLVQLNGTDESLYQLQYVPDDWTRYVIASCYADGKTTSTELAGCSGFVLEVDSFLACLSGGVCVPELFDHALAPEHIDLLEVIAADDPVAAARGILANKVHGCEQLSAPSDAEFAECITLSVLGDDQRLIYECHQRSDTALELLSCAGSNDLSEQIALYERCSVDGIAAAECMLDSVDNEYLQNASRCVNFDETADIVTCAVDANLDIDQSRVLSCLQYSDNVDSRSRCLTDEYLDDDQAALLECSRESRNVADFGLCSAEKNGSLTREELLAAECLLDGTVDSTSLLDCAGGRFAGNEIAKCLSEDTPVNECFDTETIITDVINSTAEDLIDTTHFENQIAMFRSDMYALEGGDLSVLLASNTGRNFLASSTAAAEAVVSTVKKKTGGIFKKFGFGKK